MKIKFAAFFAFLFSLNSLAGGGTPINFKCVTNPPTTSFLVQTLGDKVMMQMIHHNTTAYMPIFNGILTPSDIEHVKEKALLLPKLGEQVDVSWDINRCKKDGEGLYSCFGGGKKTIGSVPVDSFYFLTSKVKEEIFDLSFEKTEVRFSFQYKNRLHDIVMEYYGNSCNFDE